MIKRLTTGRRSLIIICTILFLTFLDNTVVSVVLSNIQTNLSAGVQDLQWIVNAYMLVFAVLMLTGGTLGDILGRKKVLLAGVALFVTGSLVAMLSNSIGMLIAGRVIMGIGAAASEPGTLSMIRHLYPDKAKRSRALGVWAAVSGIALAFGPIIGGIIIGFTNWRGVFAFSAIFGVLAFIAGLLVLPESSSSTGQKLDITGLVLGAMALSELIFAVISGENNGYSTWWIVLLFVLSFVTSVAFIYFERRKDNPVLPLQFFRKTQFSVANIVAFVTNFGIFAVFFFVALYLQLISNFSGYQIALSFIAMAASIVAGAILAGRWYINHQTIMLTIAGCLISGAGIFIINSILSPTVSSNTLAWALAISGFGFGISLVTMTSSVLNIVPPERSGMAASTVNSFRELGGVFGVAVLGSIVNGQLSNQLLGQLRALHLPANFQSFVIYAITHGGNTPKGVSVSPAVLATHAQLINQVSQAADNAFGNGLTIALNIAGTMLLVVGVACYIVYLTRKRDFSDSQAVI
ncbi:MAG TPA: MFS transporter [Candidatus Saccharimonadales bacterium]|jgi:EmrB/QacA subfamily drug resistance transporter|nr:MFS transporter [Candidatus Saccharimonadales bacterium]